MIVYGNIKFIILSVLKISSNLLTLHILACLWIILTRRSRVYALLQILDVFSTLTIGQDVFSFKFSVPFVAQHTGFYRIVTGLAIHWSSVCQKYGVLHFTKWSVFKNSWNKIHRVYLTFFISMTCFRWVNQKRFLFHKYLYRKHSSIEF
jgi:hypothetical protein